MTNYERIFGTGPRGFLISSILLAIAAFVDELSDLPKIMEDDIFRYSIFGSLSTITVLILIWSIKSLPPTDRGNKLIKVGAYKYLRHPLYGAYLSFFNFGFALFLNSWIYILWAVILHPIWHWNVKGEEQLMEQAFSNEYTAYALKTGRFFPRLLAKS